MDGNLNGVERPGTAEPVVGAPVAKSQKAYCDGLTTAITFVWEERSRHPATSEAFVALTKAWAGLREHRRREEAKWKPS